MDFDYNFPEPEGKSFLKKSSHIFNILLMCCINHLKTPSASFVKGPGSQFRRESTTKEPTETKINL